MVPSRFCRLNVALCGPCLNRFVPITFSCLVALTAQFASAQSFTVDKESIGLPGTALRSRASDPQDVFNNVNPPGPVPPGSGFSGNNLDDVIDPDSPDRDALSAGFEPLDSHMLWDVIFSVDRTSQGLPGTNVFHRASGGHAVGADLFYANPGMGPSRNGLLSLGDVHHGLSDGPASQQEIRDNIDGVEVFDSRAGVEIPYEGFRFTGDRVFDSINAGTGGDADIRMDGVPFLSAGQLGLSEEDNVDALAMDHGFEEKGEGDGVMEVLFSLAPGSPTLAGPDGKFRTPDDFSPADIFYTDLSGAFDIAGPTGLLGKFPANITFPFDLTAKNLGLRFDPQEGVSDNIDAIDVIQTMTIYDIPENPGDTPVIPRPNPNPLGDFNQNGSVGSEDLELWEAGLGKLQLAEISDGDGDGDGDVDGKDFLIWQRGFSGGAAPAVAVPEPGYATLAMLAAFLGAWGERRREV